MKKKLLIVLFAFVLVFSLVGCSNNEPLNDGTNNTVREDIDDAADSVKNGVKDTGDAIRDGVDDTGDAIRDDVNMDNKVDISDAILLLRVINGKLDNSLINMESADMDGVGGITTADAILILRNVMDRI